MSRVKTALSTPLQSIHLVSRQTQYQIFFFFQICVKVISIPAFANVYLRRILI